MPFVPGISGNPNGRGGGKVKPFKTALLMALASHGTDHRALRAIANAMISKAQCGDVEAAKFIAERLDGKVPQPIGQSDELGPARLHISWGNVLPDGNNAALEGGDVVELPVIEQPVIEQPSSDEELPGDEQASSQRPDYQSDGTKPSKD